METWIVTGAAGFIGSNLCSYLANRGVRIVGFDNFASGTQANIARVQQAHGDSFHFIEGDIRDADALARAFEGVVVCMHLAAHPYVQESFERPDYTSDVNVTGFCRVLQAASGCRAFVYASSCAMYGDANTPPIAETAPPSPLSPYASSKLANEMFAANMALKMPTTQLTGLRFFNIYGPWQDPRGAYAAVISKWIDAAMADKPPMIFGDGEATRDFLHVHDLCRLLYQLGDETPKRPHDVFNVGTGQTTTLNGLWSAIKGMVETKQGRSLDVVPDYQPWRDGDILHSCSDMTKTTRDLHYTAELTLKAGIAQILEEQYTV